MGDEADHLFDIETDQQVAPNGWCHRMHVCKRNAQIGRLVWTQKSGIEMKFEDMAIKHLENVVRLLERDGYDRIDDLKNYVLHRKAKA